MKRALVQLAVAGLVLSALGFQLSSTSSSSAIVSVVPRITQAVDESQRVILKGNTHPLARAQYDRGAAPPDLPLNRMLLVLKRSPEQESALRQLLDEQQDKSSPNYHKWLTPDEFGKQFGPADQDIQVTVGWLQTHGFRIGKVARGRTVIEFSGTAAQVQEAFATPIHQYVVNGNSHWANATDPQIPAALTPVVGGVVSLNNFPRKSFSKVVGPVRRFKNSGAIQPLFTFTPPGVNTFYAVGPGDFATIYNVQALWNLNVDGTGQTIAIVGMSDINVNDVAQFRSLFGLPFNNPTVIYNGPNPGVNGAETEALLDVEWSGAVAKGATIDYVVSEDTETTAGIDLSAIYIVDNDLAPVMSESFGLCEAALGSSGNSFFNTLWGQAAAQGITVSISAGDGGSAGCDDFNTATQAQFGLEVSGYASTPYNVAVGGTDFDQMNRWSTYWNAINGSTNSSAKSYIPETTWNDSCAGAGMNGCTSTTNRFLFNIIGGSGGPSNCSTSIASGGFIQCQAGTQKPSWQIGPGVPNDFVRDTPDISLFASNGFRGSFYIVCESDALPLGSCDLNAPYSDFLAVGGTSASAPAFAGIMALVNQKVNSRQGQANYILYPLASQPGKSCNSSTAPPNSASCIFYDVTKGNNSVPCVAGSLDCATGPMGGSGILVNPGSPSVPAWSTTPGYDLATGLGSVNVANLINNWTSSFSGTSTTLLLNGSSGALTITHGQAVTVSIGVSPAVNGTVSLLGQPNTSPQGIQGFALNGGIAGGTTTSVPGGPTPSHSYNVWAHFPGNGSYGASDSTPPIVVTVNPEASNTFLHLVALDPNTLQVTNNNATAVAYGSPYLLRVDILNAANQACPSPPSVPSGCPTGSIQITDNGNQLGTGSFVLNSLGYTEDQAAFSQFAVGQQVISATYPGDNSYNQSSANATFSVTPDPTAVAVSIAPNFQGATFRAVLSTTSAVAAPTGQITFTIDGQVANSVPLGGVAGSGTFQTGLAFASGTAAFSDPTIANGSHTLLVSYSGDNNYAVSESAPLAFNLQPDFTFLASGASMSIARPGGAGSMNLSISPLDGFTGNVSFACSGLPSESTCNFSPATLKGSGSTILTVTTTSPKSSNLQYPRLFLWATGGGAGIVGIFFIGVPARSKRWRLILGALLAFFLAGVGCGGGGNSSSGPHDPGTAAGTYNVTVSATSGSLVHQVGFQLVIQ